jgi:hypothetical protein
MADKKKASKSGRVHESLASDATAAVIGKHMDERAALVESALKKRTNAEAHNYIARGAEQEYQEAVRGSVRFLSHVAEELFPKVPAEARAALTAALISAYGTGLVEIHLKLGRAAGMVEDARTHLESLPEFAKHTI